MYNQGMNQQNRSVKQADQTPESSGFGSATSLFALSPRTGCGPPSNGETPEPTPNERRSSVSGATTGTKVLTGSAHTSQGTISPHLAHHTTMPYPPPPVDSTTNRVGSFAMPSVGRGEEREPSITSLLMTARDAPAEVITGIRYRYMPAISKWSQEEIVLRVLHPNRGVSQDPLHVIFAVQLLPERDPNRSLNTREPSSGSRGHVDLNASTGSASPPTSGRLPDDFDEDTERFMPALARMFRHTITDVSEDDYFGEAQCQTMAEEFAHIYHRMKLPDAQPGQRRPPLPLLTNRFLVRVPRINIPDEYVEATKGFFSYRTHDTHEVMFLVEPDVSTCDALGIRFPPINASDARVADLGDEDAAGEEPYYPRGDPSWDKQRYVHIAEAFSHMCYHLSGRALLVEGLQRTCGYLVDPIVYSKDRKQFGMCNSGLRGLSKWVARHTCNDVCALLQLPPVKRFSEEPHTGTAARSQSYMTGDAETGGEISALDTYPSYFTDFAQCLCSMVTLPLHRGRLDCSRSPMVASPLPQFSPRRRDRLPLTDSAAGNSVAPLVTTSQPAAPPQIPVATVASPLTVREATPQRRVVSPRTVHRSTSATERNTSAPSSPKKVSVSPRPARLPPRNALTTSPPPALPTPNGTELALKPAATVGNATGTTIRMASPRVTRKGPPPSAAAASARRAANTVASPTPAVAPGTGTTTTTTLPPQFSAPAPQIVEPRKTSTPPHSPNRHDKYVDAAGTPPRASVAVDVTPDRQCTTAVASRVTGGGGARALPVNESPKFGRTSPRSATRYQDPSVTASPPRVGTYTPTPKTQRIPPAPSTRVSTAAAVTSRDRPLRTSKQPGTDLYHRSGTTTGITASPPHTRRCTQKSSSTPDFALQPLPNAPPSRLPASARGVTKNLSFVRIPTSRALTFERQPSGPPLAKQRPLPGQATTASLPSADDSFSGAASSLVTPMGSINSPRGPRRESPLPRSQQSPALNQHLPLPPPHPPTPLAAKSTNAATNHTASPLKRTNAHAEPSAPGYTPPPERWVNKAPEAFKRSATDVPIRSYGVGSPLLFRTNQNRSPPLLRPPAPVPTHWKATSAQSKDDSSITTTAPPLLPTSPWRGNKYDAMRSSPPPRPQEPSKPTASANIDMLAQTTGGLDIQRQYIFPATKYVYNVQKLEWRRHRTLIRICNPDAGVAQGAMRVCFEVNEVSLRGNGREVPHVAKMFRRTVSNVVEQDYFTEVEMQCLCGEFARNYNAEPVVEQNAAATNRVQMNYVTAVVVSFDQKDIPEDLWAPRKGFFSYHTSDTDRCMFSMEPMLIGHFTKYNSNFGEAYRSNEKPLGEEAAAARYRVFEAAEALSHYSLVKSEGGLLLCDVQGVGNELTDPEMHTYDGDGLSIGNMGKRGIDRFAQRHRCNDACRAIGLKSLCMKAPKLTPEVLANNPYIKIMHKMRTTFTKCA